MQYLKLMILQKITFYTFRSIIREQLLARHLVDTTTALVPHHCLVGSVEIRRTKDFHPLDNARAEHNKTPNRHNHRLGADNNGVMIHLLFLHSLHAVHDIDAGREFVPLLGLLHTRHAIDTLCVGRNVGCDVADAVSDWLNHHFVGD